MLVVLGMWRLRFDAEPLALLPDEVPSVAGLRWHQRDFPAGRELIVTVRADAPDVALRTAEAVASDLGSVAGLASRVRWQVSFETNLAENIAWMWMQQPAARLQELESRLAPGRLGLQLAEARERLATSLDPMEMARTGYDPLGLLEIPGLAGKGGPMEGGGAFANASGTFRIVMVEPAGAMNYRQATEWLMRVRTRVDEVVRRLGVAGAVEVGFTGGPAFLSEVANGMESDLRTSVLSTVLVIALLFWLAHRSFRPLVLLVAALGLTLLLTLAAGGLVLGTLNVISCGFAAVMMGLVVDYGLVGYQEFRANPGAGVADLRRRVLPGVGWSAVTTAGTFLSLGLAGLPGLAQLGVLTAVGLGIGAVVMLFWFLPRIGSRTQESVRREGASTLDSAQGGVGGRLVILATAALLVACVGVLVWRGWPVVDGGAEPLRPRNSPAYATMERLQREIGRGSNTTWLLFRGATATEVGRKMEASLPVLEQAVRDGRVTEFQLPVGFWPRPELAQANRDVASRLSKRTRELGGLLEQSGFSTNAMALAGGVLTWWQRWTAPGAEVPVWPGNDSAQWLAGLMSARSPDGGWTGLATVNGAVPAVTLPGLPEGVLVTGWDRLGPDLMARVGHRVKVLTWGIALVLVGCLWLAFRRWTEVLLSLAALAMSFLVLLAVMTLLGARWNLLNLVALPLLLGTSVDSTIHVQLAMRRERGRLGAVWRTTGVALVLCAGANIAGFGSLAWSSNAGLASLDLVCAGGVLCVLFTSLVFLPRWWLALRPADVPETGGPEDGTSQFYGAAPWKLACAVARFVPRGVLAGVARGVAWFYGVLRPGRLEIVAGNLRPVVSGDAKAGVGMAKSNLAAFATKLVDLWRQEAGAPVAVEAAGGWESYHAAIGAGRGVLLVTPHLGNWEADGSLLTGFGVKPLVLTAPEPGSDFTEIRARARARQGVETLVVGADPFAFVQVIRRLQEGGVVALLLDRPMPGTGVEVEFLGGRLMASPAAAELARATGATILPVYVVEEGGRYRAYALPAVPYDRAQLGNREERRALTGRILRVFEPAVRQFPAQWFHFVPVWCRDAGPAKENN
jgi:predicted exporter/lauroyl/myristoyl acyltransferase